MIHLQSPENVWKAFCLLVKGIFEHHKHEVG